MLVALSAYSLPELTVGDSALARSSPMFFLAGARQPAVAPRLESSGIGV
jgi:hypothetical protein